MAKLKWEGSGDHRAAKMKLVGTDYIHVAKHTDGWWMTCFNIGPVGTFKQAKEMAQAIKDAAEKAMQSDD